MEKDQEFENLLSEVQSDRYVYRAVGEIPCAPGRLYSLSLKKIRSESDISNHLPIGSGGLRLLLEEERRLDNRKHWERLTGYNYPTGERIVYALSHTVQWGYKSLVTGQYYELLSGSFNFSNPHAKADAVGRSCCDTIVDYSIYHRAGNNGNPPWYFVQPKLATRRIWLVMIFFPYRSFSDRVKD